jgi:hypothetical protein
MGFGTSGGSMVGRVGHGISFGRRHWESLPRQGGEDEDADVGNRDSMVCDESWAVRRDHSRTLLFIAAHCESANEQE